MNYNNFESTWSVDNDYTTPAKSLENVKLKLFPKIISHWAGSWNQPFGIIENALNATIPSPAFRNDKGKTPVFMFEDPVGFHSRYVRSDFGDGKDTKAKKKKDLLKIEKV